jgi:WD40 repeat protein/predicted negative regulator of RcsB-dependent stress response/energy-coupling factor transporter ATP-binding protein EcfA2
MEIAREALVVGINSYPALGGSVTQSRNLEQPAADAEAVAQRLEKYGNFRVRRLPEFYDQGKPCVADTKLVKVPDLEEAIAQLFNPPSDTVPDTALLFFAGHGLRNVQGGITEGFLATSDANPKKRQWGVSLQWLRRLLEESPVPQQIIWLDCCHSGEVLNFEQADPGAKGKARDRCFIAASRDFEAAREGLGGSQHGVLTEALLSGLNPETQPEERVTNYTLVEVIKSKLSTSRQRPMFHNSGANILLTGRKETIERAVLKEGTCPYKGLESFDFNDQDPHYFHGRTALTDQLLEKVRQGNFLAVVGASGSGKSSLVKAGLLHQLKVGQRLSGSDQWEIRIFRPGEHPLRSLALAFDDVSEPGQAESLVSQGAAGLAEFVRKVIQKFDALRVVLLVDQFEELFTLCRDDNERQQFFACLLEATFTLPQKEVGGLGLTVVITIRADFVGKCAEQDYGGLASCIQENSVMVTPMNQKELEAAITEPAKQVGLEIEPELVQQMLQDVEGSGSLPLLQYTLTEMWEQRRTNCLTLTEYTQLGGVKGTLQKQADQVYSSLSEEHKLAAKRIFLELTQLGEATEDTRRQVPKQDLINDERSKELVEQVILQLANARLLVTSQGEKNGTKLTVVDIAHEVLIRQWQRLRQWLTDNREAMRKERKLEEAALEWQSRGKPEERAFLLEGIKLQDAQQFLKDYADLGLLSTLTQEFIRVSQDYHERLRQQEEERQRREREQEQKAREQEQKALREARKTIQLGIASFIVVAGVAVVAVGFAQESRKQAQLATAEKLAATAEWIRSQEPHLNQTSVLVAVESMKRFQDLNQPSGEAKRALRAGLALLPQTVSEVSHENWVRAVAFSEDGQYLATASDDNTAAIWNVDTGKKIAHIRHEDKVEAVAFSQDGQFLATASDDNTAAIWEVKTGKEITRVRHEDWVRAVAFSKDDQYLATASDDNTARLWDVKTGQEVARINHESAVTGVTFGGDGQLLATASDDNTTRIWDVKTSQEVARINHEGSVKAVSFSGDGQYLATASLDNTAHIWEVKTSQEVAVINHEDEVYAVSFSPDSQFLATASRDNTAHIWEVKTGKEVVGIRHDDDVYAVSFSPDGQFLATTSDDNTARIWEIKTSKEIARISHKDKVEAIAFSPDGQFLATTSDDNTARISEFKTTKGVARIRHEDVVEAVTFSPDGQFLATASDDNTARIWDVNTGKEINRISHKGEVDGVAFSPDGQFLATASDDKTARIWDVNTVREITTISHDDEVESVAFSPNGQFLATASGDKTARIWDVNTGKEMIRIRHEDEIEAIAFSPDGQFLATASDDNTARIWEANTGKEIDWISHESAVTGIAFSPDGQFLATASDDNTARILEVETGKQVVRIRHEDEVKDVSFSPDGQFLATASDDNTARIWDVNSGKEVKRINNESQVTTVAFSPDNQLATGSGDHTVRLWTVNTGKDGEQRDQTASADWEYIQALTTEACSRLNRNLTAGEWQTYIVNELGKYRKTCPDRPVHPSLLEAAGTLVSQGEKQKSLAIIRRAKSLDPEIDLNPYTEAIDQNPKTVLQQFSALAKVEEAEELARAGNVPEAVASYTQAQKLDPDIDLNPDTEDPENDPKSVAYTFAALGKVKQGEQLAGEGNVQEAIASYTEAQEFDPAIDLNPYTNDKENDPKAVANTFAAQGKVEAAERLAREGNVQEAIASYTQAQQLDANIDLNPYTEEKENDPNSVADTFTALGKVKAGERLARDGKVQEAIASYTQAQQLDPDSDLNPYTDEKENDPKSVAYTFAALGKVKDGERLARDGKIQEAIASYTQAQQLDPDSDLNPHTKVQDNNPKIVAQTFAAPGKVKDGEKLAREGKIPETIASYSQAQQLDPTLDISAFSWHQLCWFGSLHQQTTQVMDACKTAVILAPENGNYKHSRGLARALTGNTAGAIKDFQAYIEWTNYDEDKARVQRWIDALRADKNPFTPEELEMLLNE